MPRLDCCCSALFGITVLLACGTAEATDGPSILPTRVLVDADAALITPDPGNRVIEALAGHRDRLDACLNGMVAAIERGAPPAFEFDVGVDGRLTKLAGAGGRAPPGYEVTLACVRGVLASLSFGTAPGRRHGTLYLKGDRAVVPVVDLAADSVTITKRELGVDVVMTATRRVLAGGDTAIAYTAKLTNAGKVRRGVRRSFVFSDYSLRHGPSDSTIVSTTTHPDDTTPITCLEPGQSLSHATTPSQRDGIARGGRYAGSPFVIVGDCDNPRERIHVGGFRLDWAAKAARPSLVALPYWVHAIEPFEPRERWR